MPSTAAPRSLAEIDFEPTGPVTPSPLDWRDQFIYQILIDRYDDDKEHPPFDADTAPRGRDPDQAALVQGGTLRGITRRLDYIQGLGVTTIWITPPFKNRIDDPYAHHGYGIQDFLDVDPRFGTIDDLRRLVREAHKRGMYVILDIVINHTGDCWAYAHSETRSPTYNGSDRFEFGGWRKHGGGVISHDRVAELGPDDGVWPREFQNPDWFKRRGAISDISNAGPEEQIDGDFITLKDLDLKNPEVLDALIKVYKWWIAQTDIDGFRMDTIMNTEPAETAIFTNSIREYARRIGKHNFFMYAEIVGDDDRLQKYIGGIHPVPGVDERYPFFSACLDFPLYFILEEVIKGFRGVDELRERYEKFRRFYRDYGEVGRCFVTFIDNHDQMARPYRRFMHQNNDWRQAVLGVGYLLCNMGVPCIYYGTEQGFDGGGKTDHAVRECMFGGKWGAFDTTGVHFFNPEHPIYRGIARVAEIRRREMALRYGRQYFREISSDGIHFGCQQNPGGIVAFSRVLDTEEVVVVLNLDDRERDDRIEVDGRLTPEGSDMLDLVDGQRVTAMRHDSHVFIAPRLKPRSISIFRNHG